MIFQTKPELETAPQVARDALRLIAIEAETAQLQNEAAQLAALQNELSPELQNNQGALIAGDVNAIATASGVAARLNAVTTRRSELAAQLQMLNEQAVPLRAELARASNEARLRDELRALASASTATFEELENERARVDAFLNEAAPLLSDARRNLEGQRAQFLGIVSQLAPGVGVPHNPYTAAPNRNTSEYAEGQDKLNVLLELFSQLENEGANLSFVRSDFQSGHGLRAFDRQTAFAPRKYEKALNVIEGIV